MDPSVVGVGGRPPKRGREEPRLASDEGGFVLPWFALMLLVLIAMAGFGVDVWNWWYTAQKVQRAADAGALAGVTFMPGNLNGPSPNATTTAVGTVKQNGYPSAQVAQGGKANQLVVTVSQTVTNSFTSLLGNATTTITRSATAEFNAPIQMGSPVGHFGNDPENGATDQHWLNIGAPHVDKRTGDRYADYTSCSGGTFSCTGSTNTEYTDTNYVYTVDLPSLPAGGADIQVYDPEYADGHTSCDNQWLSGAQIGTLQSTYPDAATRFATGQNNFCTGDDPTNLGTPQATAWIVRDSLTSQFQPLANQVVGSGGPAGPCVHQFAGYDPPASSPNYWFDLLDPNDTDGTGAFAADGGDFAKAFHRYYTICHVTSAGRYFIQARSNVPFSSAQRNTPSYVTKSEFPTPENTNIGGQNRYSVRVVQPNTNTVVANAATYAVNSVPVYTNTTGSNTPNFFLARLLPGGGTTGRILQLEFFDIGDLATAGNTTTLTVSPPVEATGGAVTCSQWVFNGSAANAPPSGSTFGGAGGCTLGGITSNSYPGGFNGVLVDVKVQVPGTYNCNTASPNGCWFKVSMSYSAPGAQANDTTTWGAKIGGDPVRLVK